MANVLVIGASGQIGKQATVKLLDAGHKVLAPVRSPEKLSDIQNDDLTVVEQDLEEDFSAHFSNDAINKDLHLLQDLAYSMKKPLYSAAIPKELFSKMKMMGKGDEDFSSIYQLFKS